VDLTSQFLEFTLVSQQKSVEHVVFGPEFAAEAFSLRTVMTTSCCDAAVSILGAQRDFTNCGRLVDGLYKPFCISRIIYPLLIPDYDWDTKLIPDCLIVIQQRLGMACPQDLGNGMDV